MNEELDYTDENDCDICGHVWHGLDDCPSCRRVKKWKAYFNGELWYSDDTAEGLVHYINYRYWTGDGLQRYADKWGGVAVFDGVPYNVVVTTEEL